MDSKFTKPKGFGEILDHTFALSKDRFKDLFMILLILLGPIYLLQAIIQLISGKSFFREVGEGTGWLDQIISSFEDTGTLDTSSIGFDIGFIVVGILMIFLAPVAEAAILFAVDHIRKDEEFTVGSVIKQGFSRFWPMIGSSILFGLIAFGIFFLPILIIVFAIGIFASTSNIGLTILMSIVLFLGFGVLVAYLLTRWSFYFGSVVLDRKSPGFGRSWKLTRKRTWPLIGLYIVFYLIISIISFAIAGTLTLALGDSVLLSIISNLVTLLTTMIFSIGYAIMYLDLKTRHDADDLKELIDDYQNPPLMTK